MLPPETPTPHPPAPILFTAVKWEGVEATYVWVKCRQMCHNVKKTNMIVSLKVKLLAFFSVVHSFPHSVKALFVIFMGLE